MTDCENPPEVIPSTAPGGGLPTKHVMVAGMLAVVAPCKATRRCYGQGQLTSLKAGAGATVWCETDERRYHVCSFVDNHSA